MMPVLTLTPERLFLLALAVAAFAVAMLVLVDSIRWKRKDDANREHIRRTGFRLGDERDWRGWKR